MSNPNEIITLHKSDNTGVPIQKSDVSRVLAEQVTQVVLEDGREIYVRETPQQIAEIMRGSA